MRESSRTFQNGLSNPDFRYRPRQIYERRGKYIKGYDRSECECCVQRGRLGGVFSVQQVLANPWGRTETAWKSSKRNSNRTSRRIKASFTRVIDPTRQQIILATLLGRRHPQGSHQRTGPHTGLSLAEEPECRSNSYLARKGRGEEGPRGLSEDTDGVIDQRRKKDSEDLPPAHSSRDSLWISSPRPGYLLHRRQCFARSGI
ncbi:hypothetical protein GEV33_004267 [Tenebrio molitor]|uniref:Uncharacterized protein n=1 Tax=Tenebrio molitor TaxID=7067 RepID=A0A8J6HPT7_TENMO|nr:hypothetical protein GEV33_004267 [Tenebrio molitor]